MLETDAVALVAVAAAAPGTVRLGAPEVSVAAPPPPQAARAPLAATAATRLTSGRARTIKLTGLSRRAVPCAARSTGQSFRSFWAS